MGVLDGIKILELARVPPAEMPAMIMADMGAEVLKIDSPDPERPTGDEWVRRTIHSFTNRNKRSMTLNMKSPDGQAIFRKLAASADVIVEGFRPGVMKRLGADYESLRASNPRLIYCSLSGFGQDGPYRDYPAHDMNYLSLAGVLGLIGDAGSMSTCLISTRRCRSWPPRRTCASSSATARRHVGARASSAARTPTTPSTRPATASC
jgi:alpha-methylacyl-CoA racemase